MKPYTIGFLLLMSAIHVNMKNLNVLDDVLVYPIPAPMNIEKRETSQYFSESIDQFIEEKLTEHSQALEHILRILDHREEFTKQIFEYRSENLEQPKLPVKIEPQTIKQDNARRSNDIVEHPVFRLGKNIPKYGKLATDIFLKEIHPDADPTPLIETVPNVPWKVNVMETLKSNRRSFDDSQDVEPNQQNSFKPSPWCEIAVLCKKSTESMCGFDDSYGYGKFDDICHMLNVNCYYRYNFVLVDTCHPTL